MSIAALRDYVNASALHSVSLPEQHFTPTLSEGDQLSSNNTVIRRLCMQASYSYMLHLSRLDELFFLIFLAFSAAPSPALRQS